MEIMDVKIVTPKKLSYFEGHKCLRTLSLGKKNVIEKKSESANIDMK